MSWPVQEAKARFSELLEKSVTEGPQIVTKRGVETAVLVPIDEWRRLQQRARPTLKELLLAPEPRFELEIPDRNQWRWRSPPKLKYCTCSTRTSYPSCVAPGRIAVSSPGCRASPRTESLSRRLPSENFRQEWRTPDSKIIKGPRSSRAGSTALLRLTMSCLCMRARSVAGPG